MQRIIDQELFGDPNQKASEARYTWEPDEIAYLVENGIVSKVKFTGERKLSNLGWRSAKLKKMYGFERLAAMVDSFGDRSSRTGEAEENGFYKSLDGAKSRAVEYWERKTRYVKGKEFATDERTLHRMTETIDQFLLDES